MGFRGRDGTRAGDRSADRHGVPPDRRARPEDLGRPSPQGWTETEDWGSPAALVERLDWSDEIARRFVATRDVRQLAEAVVGPTLSTDTATAIARAESRQQALALLLMSPEMQRR
ncbi:DUF1800 family protein [Methyloraptor flagellatus]|uniref:DUF1800 family protein n=1 Tax=Methyloraptor flagellatus TaxID=3162530 RepID=A0AAU7XH78_9HYPH